MTILPADGSRQVRPGAGVTVRATNGHVQKVVVTTTGSVMRQVSGGLNTASTVWRSAAPLLPSQSSTVVATALSAGGQKVTASSSFKTLTPRKTAHVTLLEADHQAYGVGMPIVLTFSGRVTNR